MKEFVDEVVEEASKEGQVNTWLREIEESGPVIRHRMELCLKLKRMEEERAVKLMLAEDDRDRRKELQEGERRIGCKDIGRERRR